MKKVNIAQQLHKMASDNLRRQNLDAEKLLESVKENLAKQDTADLSMLQYFGTQEVINTTQTKKRSVEQWMQTECVSFDDIRRVCWKYNLRFLPAKSYKKEIPLKTLNDLNEFSKGQPIDEGNLMVIAPKSHFALGKRPVKDPVLLYRISKNKYYKHEKGDYYKVISKWGSDFSFTRQLVGLYKNFPNLINFSLLCILTVVLYLRGTVPGEAFGLLSVIAFAYVVSLYFESDEATNYNQSIRDVWNSPYKD